MNRGLFKFVFAFSLLLATSAAGQEPAYLYGSQAVRYVEGPDFFHYVIPCKQAVEGTALTDLTAASTKMQPGLCWPVRTVRLELVNGKFERREQVDGTFAVSASILRFLPSDPTQLSLAREMVPQRAMFRHPKGASGAVIATSDIAYSFSFTNICSQCASGTTEPQTGDLTQLDQEYDTFGASLTQFDTVAERINGIAAQMRVGVTAKNQPTLQDPPEAMGLYSDLNQRFAELCQEPAKSCVHDYAKYQGCKAGDLTHNCGDPPSCSAFCSLTGEAFRGLKVTVCTSPRSDSATLIPDWTEVVRKIDAERAARGPVNPKTINVAAGPPSGPPLDFMGKPIDPNNHCTVESGYALAMMTHLGAPGLPGVGAGAGSKPDVTVIGPTKIAVSAGVIASNKIGGATPVYPAVAKAARIQGTVVLSATISKAGAIENLQIISGPPLLQQAALDAVKTWQYRPYLLNGRPVEVETQVNVIFVLGASAPTQSPANNGPTP